MTFLLEVVVEYLARTAVWLAAETLVAVVGAALIILGLLATGRQVPRRRVLIAAIVGAVVATALVDRFDLPTAANLEIWRRNVPMVWSFSGSVLGAAAAAAWATLRPPSAP